MEGDEEGEQETELNHQQCFNKQLEAAELQRRRQTADILHPPARGVTLSVRPSIRPPGSTVGP